ncbi:MAG: ABC transporter permease DevC [Xenococcaceae cyanobacterium MO_188.B32]|nr:ABC transporter permease DevC [Xenococcaceae cyanobacterium MO_188.B32]
MNIQTLLTRFNKEPPLGWAQLRSQKVRLLVALIAIASADIIIFTMQGFRLSMFGGATNLHKQLRGDLFLVSNRSEFLADGQTFSRRHLYQAEAIDGVSSANPLYFSFGNWVNPWNNKMTSVGVIAFDPVRPVIDLPEIDEQLEQIKLPNTVLFDSLSHPNLGSVSESFIREKTVTTEISGHRVSVGGIFTLGSTIFIDGHIITSDWNYLRLFGSDSIDNLKVGILILEPDADLATVKSKVQAYLPQDVEVMTHQEFIKSEEDYWAEVPGGILFNFGVAMGFFTGVVIVYEVLHADVNDHLAEYATLKAMGYSDRNLLMVVFQEGIVLGVLGFIPGFIGSIGIYTLLGYMTRIPLPMRFDVVSQVFILTILMCLISAAIAIRKLQSADPADVF